MLPTSLIITGPARRHLRVEPDIETFDATWNGARARFHRRTAPAPHLRRARERFSARKHPERPGWAKVLASSSPDDESPWLVLEWPEGVDLSTWLANCAARNECCHPALAVQVIARTAELVADAQQQSHELPGALITDVLILPDASVRLGSLGSLSPASSPTLGSQTRHLLELLRTLAGPDRPRALDMLAIEVSENPSVDNLASSLRELMGRLEELEVPSGLVPELKSNLNSATPPPLRRVPSRPPPPDEVRTLPVGAREPDLPRTFDEPFDEPSFDNTIVGGRYRLGKPIGSGSMGHVFEATDVATDKAVAVKVVAPRVEEAGPEYVVRFRREAEVLSRLHHPNIVSVHGYGTRGTCWMAMELVHGHSLVELLDPWEPLPLGLALTIARQVADALSHAHARGIVHRDIKPGNLLVASQDPLHVKLCDFGLAKVWDQDEETVTGALIGTPQYMSPEQAKGLPAEFRADLYATGILLYRLITGRTPYADRPGPSVLLAHVSDEPPPMAEANLRVDVPYIVQDVVDRCLAKAPEDRYANAELLVADLQRCIDRLASPTDPTPALAFPYRESQAGEAPYIEPEPEPPKPWVWVAILAVMAVAGLFGGWVVWTLFAS